MTSRLSVRNAVNHLNTLKDPQLEAQAKEAAKILLEACDLAGDLSAEAPEWTGDDVLKALTGVKTLLAAAAPKSTAEIFAKIAAALTDTYLAESKLSDDLKAKCAACDWKTVTTDEALNKGLVNPENFAEGLVAGMNPEIEPFTSLIIHLTLRVILQDSVREADRRIADNQKDTIHFNRPLKCPVCGGLPAIACVAGTAYHGNVKQLFCVTCGAHWPFDRIRCAVCGDQAVSDLSYVHDSGDESRRLHVCKSCHAAFPTVFVNDLENFDQDVDGIAISGLAAYYSEEQAKKANA